MQSDTQTNSSTILQLPVELTMYEWGVRAILDGQKDMVLKLFAAVPAIQNLAGHGISVYDLHTDEIEDLCKLTEKEAAQVFNQLKLDCHYSKFKDSLIIEANKCYDRILGQRKLKKEEDQLEVTFSKAISALKEFLSQSTSKLRLYLKLSRASQEQLLALEYYNNFQKQQIDNCTFVVVDAFLKGIKSPMRRNRVSSCGNAGYQASIKMRSRLSAKPREKKRKQKMIFHGQVDLSIGSANIRFSDDYFTHLIFVKQQQYQTSAESMQTQSDLYFQSQEYITPIIDYIPLPDNTILPASSRWRMKEDLDQSQQKPRTVLQSQHNMSSVRMQSKIERVNTDSAANDYDKKTTSIMQGRSANTIPSNEPSISTIRDNLRSYATQHKERIQNQNNHSYLTNQNKSVERQKWRGRSREDQTSLHFMKERSRLLRNIDRSLESQRYIPERERIQLSSCKMERNKLIRSILNKLESTIKDKKEIELVKSNCKDTSVSPTHQPHQKSGIFVKKVKKWVQTKNALKNAAQESTQQCISTSKAVPQNIVRNVISQWKSVDSEPIFESPTLIPRAQTIQTLPITLQNASNPYIPPKRSDDQIFTFNNLHAFPFQTHIKNVSISVSESSSKEYIGFNGQVDQPISECVLCKVIGKKCSFH